MAGGAQSGNSASSPLHCTSPDLQLSPHNPFGKLIAFTMAIKLQVNSNNSN